MQTVSSENFKCLRSLSPSEYTETVEIFNSLQALIALSAISPLFAMRTLKGMII